ncbi:MAG: DNA primase DnaG [Candidatus Pacearchaeota archaeon]
MAKISPVSIKYMIHAKFEAFGPVEKPDVIGAIFGQTEGLLGSELEIRDLQNEGKIGRIEVETEPSNGKTIGKIFIPTALDQSETSLIAAAIETIERVGPTEAKIVVEKIEDVRGNKREYIIERAKKLMESIDGSASSREISNLIKASSRISKLQEYGEEKLPAGDLSGEEIIVVEGRADVINLLENRVYNVIGMNGTKLPREIIELSKNKKITLFLDGDRGGRLIAKNVIDNANIDFVAFAPDGKEVEELNGKEILASLRKKIPSQEFSSSYFSNTRNSDVQNEDLDKSKIDELIKKVEDTDKVLIFDANLNLIGSFSKNRVPRDILRIKGAFLMIIDGKATPSLTKVAESLGCRYLVAKNFTEDSSSNMKFISF